MKLTLKNSTVLDVESVEESYYPRNEQGVVLSIRLNTDEGIEALRETFTPEALERKVNTPETLWGVAVGQGEEAKTISGYTQVDSIRKTYGGAGAYDATVDLVKGTGV